MKVVLWYDMCMRWLSNSNFIFLKDSTLFDTLDFFHMVTDYIIFTDLSCLNNAPIFVTYIMFNSS